MVAGLVLVGYEGFVKKKFEGVWVGAWGVVVFFFFFFFFWGGMVVEAILLFYFVYHARCSSVVRAFTQGSMGRWIDPSWVEPI